MKIKNLSILSILGLVVLLGQGCVTIEKVAPPESAVEVAPDNVSQDESKAPSETQNNNSETGTETNNSPVTEAEPQLNLDSQVGN